ARLSKAGMKRLDDESLLAMGAVQRKLLMQADLTGCAALTRGNPGSGLFQMLENLGAEDVDRFFDLTYQAMLAEAKQTPPARGADYVRIRQNLNTILDDLPQEDSVRLKNDLSNGTGSSDEEACWMGRTLQGGLDKLSPGDQIQWLLANAEQ
ncbi:MAG TPA: hypothetical protein VF493_20465, partial [Terriglobales bacterium]